MGKQKKNKISSRFAAVISMEIMMEAVHRMTFSRLVWFKLQEQHLFSTIIDWWSVYILKSQLIYYPKYDWWSMMSTLCNRLKLYTIVKVMIFLLVSDLICGSWFRIKKNTHTPHFMQRYASNTNSFMIPSRFFVRLNDVKLMN